MGFIGAIVCEVTDQPTVTRPASRALA